MEFTAPRLPDWRDRLETHVDVMREQTFTWGQFDCALFAADCVLAMTGVDPAPRYRQQYQTQMDAYRLLGEFDGGSLQAALAVRFASINPAHAGAGDLMLCLIDGQETCGVCLGHMVAVPAIGRGLCFFARDKVTVPHAWRV